MATLAKTKSEEINLRYWEEDGSYFQAWYPICLSSALSAEKVVGVEFLNSKVIAYRDANGKAIVQTAYCAHIGADLSLGDIVEGEVRCPYHHWRYNSEGVCSHIPTEGKGLRSARIQNYPVAERWGLVWIFNGQEPAGDVPSLIGANEDDVIWKVYDLGPMHMESWIPLTNAVDFQHLKAVHGLPHNAEGRNFKVDNTSFSFDFDFLHPNGAGKVWYHNTFAMRDLQPFPPGHFMLLASNSPRPGWQHPFAVIAMLKPENQKEYPETETKLDELREFLRKLNEEDGPIVDTIRFRPRGEAKLVKADKALVMMMDFYDQLPKAGPLD